MASTQSTNPLAPYLESNKKWVEKVSQSDPDLIPGFTGQAPPILWIGCSDSRQPESTILGVNPGTCFVHRMIANVLTATDISSAAVIEYACAALGVKMIVLCGHTGCGGCKAALGNDKIGVIDLWLRPLRQIRQANAAELQKLEGAAQGTRLAELNVLNGIEVLRQNPAVISAMKTRGLTVHGVIYDLGSGLLRELDTTDNSSETREWACETS